MKLFNLIVVPLVGARVVHTQQQIPIVADDAEDVGSEMTTTILDEAPGEEAPMVGVHFTTSYAIASVRYQNGLFRDLGKIIGDAEYVETMSWWAEGMDKFKRDCLEDPTGLSGGVFNMNLPACKENHIEGLKRVQAGQSRSRDSIVLSGFLKRVRGAVEKELGEPVERIAPAFPRLSHSSGSDLYDAFVYAGLRSTGMRNVVPQYEESHAAYAALGHGLCDASMDYTSCQTYTSRQNRETVLYLNFDNSSFSVGAMEQTSPFEASLSLSYSADVQLGWWNLPVFEVPRAKFWAKIHEMIAKAARSIQRPWHKIVLLGDHGADDEFKEVVKAAVWQEMELDVELMLELVSKDDIAHLAARGAAELGFREETWSRQAESARREQAKSASLEQV